MIRSAADFDYTVGDDVDAQHPQGDLNRISYSYQVMPNRVGNTDEKVLAGIDMAVLLEAAQERIAAATGYEPIDDQTFYREVIASQYTNALNSILRLTDSQSWSQSHRTAWIKPNATLDTTWFNNAFNLTNDWTDWWIRAFPTSMYLREDLESKAYAGIAPRRLETAPLIAMFNDLRYKLQICIGLWSHEIVTGGIPGGSTLYSAHTWLGQWIEEYADSMTLVDTAQAHPKSTKYDGNWFIPLRLYTTDMNGNSAYQGVLYKVSNANINVNLLVDEILNHFQIQRDPTVYLNATVAVEANAVALYGLTDHTKWW